MSARHDDIAGVDPDSLGVPEEIEGQDFAEKAGTKLGGTGFDE